MARTPSTAVTRYAHVRPAWPWRRKCGRVSPDSRRTCTREPGHRGPHVAHDVLRRVVDVWERQDSRTAKPAKRAVSAKKPVGLRSRGSTSVSSRLGSMAKFVDEHVEEIALAVFFIAFVWFALDWLMIILR